MPEIRGLWTVAAAFGGFFLILFLVFKILDTEFFRGDPDLGGSAHPVTNAQTDAAHRFCAERAGAKLGLGGGQAAIPADYIAWDLGFSRYLVKASLIAPAPPRTYLCKVLHRGDEDWSLQSLDFIN